MESFQTEFIFGLITDLYRTKNIIARKTSKHRSKHRFDAHLIVYTLVSTCKNLQVFQMHNVE